ncbi:MAG: FAD-dependent oxidoreductase [Candidatus Viridilinea halotolerans]|uniref:FAD-dependent oxidoreductase n=1 Tax=Candidatus Viridilinea halotolerans TaxID=2491704 RepID=A0A426U4E3_9CHLR|nr:MAG: FAD-dependent oxidoreductase [Candidatus Viridilinea halotolerans]
MISPGQQIVVIGGGLAGLAAARQLQRAGMRVVVLERAAAVGGRARTEEVGGYRIELGAEFLASFYTRTLALIDEVGLTSALRPIPRSAATLRDGQLHALWPNMRAAFTQLVGMRQKLPLSYLVGSLLRHAQRLDLHAFQKAQELDDCSVSAYARAHLSEELLEYLLQPALAGIFYWTPERTSRALLLITLRAGLAHPAGLRIFTLREGLGQLARTLAAQLDVRTNTEVLAVVPQAQGGYLVQAQRDGQALSYAAAGVVVATTASVVPQLLPWLRAEQRAFFAAIHYSATVNLAVGTRRRLPNDLYGLLFPRRETPFLASATLQTVKEGRFAPRGRDLICLHMSGPASVALREYDDATLSRVMLSELRRLVPQYDPTPHAEFQRVYRCAEALPEFDVGTFRRMANFFRGGIEVPNLVFAGDYLGGPFVEGAITSGEQAAQRLL